MRSYRKHKGKSENNTEQQCIHSINAHIDNSELHLLIHHDCTKFCGWATSQSGSPLRDRADGRNTSTGNNAVRMTDRETPLVAASVAAIGMKNGPIMAPDTKKLRMRI